MCEVIDDEHAAFLAAHFCAPLHVLKTRQRRTDFLLVDSPRVSRDD